MKVDNKLIFENSKNLNVLYIEDEAVLREATASLLSNFFNSVDSAVDGEEGLSKYKSYFENSSEYYDIVISDISMPNMDGLEMSSKIKDINYEQPILFTTAFNEPEYLHKAIKLGADGYLSKPIEMNELKSILYKTCQAIVDRKLVVQHYNQIEDINMISIDQLDASEINSATDIFEYLNKHKDKLASLWIENDIVKTEFKKNNINSKEFKDLYAVKSLEYFLNVIDGKTEVGTSPVIVDMIEFFKTKNIPFEDIFMICVNFKNTILSFIFNKHSFNQKLFHDTSYILDKNIESAIKNYFSGHIEPIKEKTPEPKKVVKKEHLKKAKVKEVEPEEEGTNYVEYVLENDVYELEDLEQDIDTTAVGVIMNKNITYDDITLLGARIKRYGSILSNYPLFSKLGACIIKLGVNFVDNAQMLADETERMSNITPMIEGFVNDLLVWRKEIFDNNIANPHFLDDSFFSNVDTIIMFITYNEEAEDSFDDGDMEFF